ncbi:S9 family peptidase [Sphingosinicella rhizophila]|uniref:S9 family peptidase n=1 Tax=Sphingosinicella rhizophila TaxID=3050082 RepID=A0ABU3Q5Q9_9SPHN|nr:S9 family peptidase [Sphingosinicella sp. GR2756]MDT9598749.1 S9 family peptidase [Sphingosinicella sp. GR2756]
MKTDLRDSPLFDEAKALHVAARQPGTGRISDAAEVSVSPDGKKAVFAGTLAEALEGTPKARICLTELEGGETHVLTFGPNSDRSPKFSPDGRHVAFLSDRRKGGDFQLHLLDPITGAASATPPVDGWVEYLHWSPDGSRILLGVAGHGADISGGQGAVASKQADNSLPSWIPDVQTGDEAFRWRRAYVYDLDSGSVRQASPDGINIWEAAWCGRGAIVAVASPGPGEGLWYNVGLQVIDIESGDSREVYRPDDQLGWPAASPSGKWIAVAEAICSDRWLVAGDLRIVETQGGEIRKVDTGNIDVTYAEWRSDDTLLIAGHRDFETVVALYDANSGACEDVWASDEVTAGGRYIQVSGFGDPGDCVLIGENFTRAPEIAIIRHGEYRCAKSLEVGFADELNALDSVEKVVWNAPDGLEIHGYLLKPKGTGPFPTILHVHGGPVWHWRPTWLGRGGIPFLMLLKRGYAIFYPNPRGSSGRGQAFARHIMGDMNGAETYDYLSGLDALVDRGIADPDRIGVTGGSYGGNMTSWLVTQDARFAAAVSVAPHTNQVTERLVSNIPHFMDMILQDDYTNPGGKYYTRSAIMFAKNVTTPTLNIAGILDKCTPPEEAVQFHNALLFNGTKSVLAVYPEEGHGIRTFPAVFDYCARLVGWFEDHIEGRS